MELRHSQELGEFSKALSIAQGKLEKAVKDKMNPHFRSKYANLESVWDACREPLTSSGLAVIQAPAFHEGRVIITTRILHTSGQWIESSLSLKPRNDDPQALGSAITYGKRYSLMAMVGVADDDDDDGNQATRRPSPALLEEQLYCVESVEHKQALYHVLNALQIHDNALMKFVSTQAMNNNVKIKDLEQFTKKIIEEKTNASKA